MSIPFIDLQAQRRRLGGRIEAAMARVVESGRFILGEEVAQLEQALARFGEARGAVACANGTDALALVLMAWGVGPGDAVFMPSFTFAATAEAAARLGASPVFVDILPDVLTLDPDALEAAVQMARREGRLTPRAVVAVDLFGQPADYPRLSAVARAHGMRLVADSAQGFGCRLHGRQPLAWADAATTSFFPAKPLGCYGDGGAVLTNDSALEAVVRSLAQHGQGETRYTHVRVGLNSRLDALQAAVLQEKLAIFAEEIAERNAVAARYTQRLRPLAATPTVISGGVSTWAQYTLELPDREEAAKALQAAGIPSAVYYATPTHLQPAYAQAPRGPLPVTEAKAGAVLSLPMSAYVPEAVQDLAAETLGRLLRRGARRAA
jgi:dTDP-4-amino-4,6-dideoxygalactose transaminase